MPPADDPLLATVLADPANDHPRLVYADWLEDRGAAERAELIRLQIALAAGWPNGPTCERIRVTPPSPAPTPQPRCRCRPCRLARREAKLLARHESDMKREVLAPCYTRYQREIQSRLETTAPERVVPEIFSAVADSWMWLFVGPAVEFRRGFAVSVGMPLADWLVDGQEVVRIGPLEEVTATDRHPNLTPASGLWSLAANDEWQRQEWWLPAAIFHRLPGGVRRPESSADNRYYESAKESTDALSAALLAWARGE